MTLVAAIEMLSTCRTAGALGHEDSTLLHTCRISGTFMVDRSIELMSYIHCAPLERKICWICQSSRNILRLE